MREPPSAPPPLAPHAPRSAAPSCAALRHGALQSIENEANVYSAYYGLPILSMRSAVFPFILEGREGYQARRGQLLLAPPPLSS